MSKYHYYEIGGMQFYANIYDQNGNVVQEKVFNDEHDAWNWAEDRVAYWDKVEAEASDDE